MPMCWFLKVVCTVLVVPKLLVRQWYCSTWYQYPVPSTGLAPGTVVPGVGVLN
jgi:hypothetical protein